LVKNFIFKPRFHAVLDGILIQIKKFAS